MIDRTELEWTMETATRLRSIRVDTIVGNLIREIERLNGELKWAHGMVDSCLPSISEPFDPDRIQSTLRAVERRTRPVIDATVALGVVVGIADGASFWFISFIFWTLATVYFMAESMRRGWRF